MSRKKFIESHGATCKNWNWSWSFVNHKEKIIIFGAWDRDTRGSISIILEKSWKYSDKDKKLPGYPQSVEHIRLIEEEGYMLKTFPMIYSDVHKDENDIGPAKIGSFIPELTNKTLLRGMDKWYASDTSITNHIPEEIINPEIFFEGASNKVSVNVYERNADARLKCIEQYGYHCAVCSFDFEKNYGSIGEKYIHVHHIIPLAEVKEEYTLDPINDLVPVCPNCHAMIHRFQSVLSIEQLIKHLKKFHKSEI
jgi:5-methylcytosine-specific restriction enzyme A